MCHHHTILSVFDHIALNNHLLPMDVNIDWCEAEANIPYICMEFLLLGMTLSWPIQTCWSDMPDSMEHYGCCLACPGFVTWWSPMNFGCWGCFAYLLEGGYLTNSEKHKDIDKPLIDSVYIYIYTCSKSRVIKLWTNNCPQNRQVMGHGLGQAPRVVMRVSFFPKKRGSFWHRLPLLTRTLTKNKLSRGTSRTLHKPRMRVPLLLPQVLSVPLYASKVLNLHHHSTN